MQISELDYKICDTFNISSSDNNFAHFPVTSASFYSSKHMSVTLQLHPITSPSLVFQPNPPMPLLPVPFSQ
jgi:hypothetical protein